MITIKNKKPLPAIPAILLAIISVQGGAAIAKSLFPTLGPAGTSSLRIGISAIILLIFNRPNFYRISPKQWIYCSAYGFSLGAMNLLFYYAIQRIPLGLGVAIEFIGPLGLAIISSKKWQDIFWVLLAFLGIMLIVPKEEEGFDLLGGAFALFAGIFWAFYILLGGKISKMIAGREAVTIGMIFASIFVIPFGISSGDLNHLSLPLLVLGCGVALLSSAIPFSLEIIALRKLPTKTFGILMGLEPVFATLSGLIFLKEYLDIIHWFAIFCIVLASIGTSLSLKKN